MEFGDGDIKNYSASLIADNMYAQVDKEGYMYNLLDSILDNKYKKPSNHMQEKENKLAKTMRGSCTILDNRISRKNRKMDYKVIFFNDDLRQKNIQKQWISCEKVISKESMMDNIQTILKTENSYFRDPHGLESLARKMKVGLNTILEAVCVMKNHHNTDELTSSMNSPDSEVRRKKRKNRTEEKKSRRFSFAMSPIQGIIN